MAKRRVGLVFIIVGLLTIAAGAAWYGYNMWDDNRAYEEASGVMAQIEKLRQHMSDESLSAIGGTHTEAPEQDTPAYVLDPEMDMPTVEIDGYRYIGTVSIPVLELELPVMETWDYVRMKISPCRYVGSAYLNDLIICGHNYESHFGTLKNLQTGDSVIFTDMAGNVFRYRVELVEILPGTAVEEMKSGGWDLTLFTCAKPARTTRVTVRCSLEKTA